MIKFELLHICKQSGARLGRIITDKGVVIETPTFMPVGTQATVKTLDSKEVEKVSNNIILSNAYHLWLQPGLDVIRKNKNVKKMMHWKKAMLTDSGGFQVFSLKGINKITEEGVYFKNPLNGNMEFLSPEVSMEIQETIGSDIMMCFDECPPVYNDYEYQKKSLERTLRWAIRCKESHKTNQALFGIVQGALYKDLRRHSIEELVKIGFDGYSIGGLSVGESNEEMYEMLECICPLMPKDKPRYLMGVGKPANLLEGVIRGVDMFDCVLPTRNARHGQIFTTEGKINIKNSNYTYSLEKLEKNIKHPYSNYTKSYVKHLFKADEILGQKIASYQNLAYLNKLMQDIREAIKNDRLLDFAEEFYKKTNYR